MKTIYDVLRAPKVTEKSTAMKSENNQVVFEVASWANKHEIKAAVEGLFKVGVDSIRTMVYRGKTKRLGKFVGQRSNWKKAIVTLKSGADVDVFGVFQETPEVPTETRE